MGAAPEPNASWPLPSLLTSLKRAHWGVLTGGRRQGVRSTLEGLAAQLPHVKAQGRTTVLQIAGAAGLSEDWCRQCLRCLEDMGVIVWHRGTIFEGKPIPSTFRIVKKKLVQLIRIARGESSRRLAQARKAFDARLSRLKRNSLPPYKRENAALRTEPSRGLTTYKGESPTAANSPQTNNSAKAESRKKMPAIPNDIPAHRLAHPCPHGHQSASRCAQCRYNAMDANQIAEWQAERMYSLGGYYQTIPAAPITHLSAQVEVLVAKGLSGAKIALAMAKKKREQHVR